MPVFQYTGYRPDGSEAAGTIEAEGLQDALSQVRALGIYPRDVHARTYREKRWRLKKNEKSSLPHVTRQLSILLSAGVPLLDALRSLSGENRGYWQGLLTGIKDSVSGGSSLSRSLEAERDMFPEFYINMVSAGEQSGRLNLVLEMLAGFLEKQEALKSKVRTAMIYPLFMMSVGFVVLSFLFTFVVPKIVKIFENTKSALPFITVLLIAISNFFVNFWWAILIAAAAMYLGAGKLRDRNRMSLDKIKLGLPGGVLQSLYLGRFSRTTAFLLEGGLPLLKALELSSKSVGNVVIEQKIKNAAKMVAEGARLSQSLEGLPSVLLQLISTGEKTGTLAEVLNRAADSYEEDFERKVQKALSLLEPSMILVMGLVVGFIVLAILLPMFQLNQLVK
ncbi:MAG: type II secretion system F family protein [Nitrospirae bacterium]|nr:type II secretion system F family protein [Nitrospirota bacterium]